MKKTALYLGFISLSFVALFSSSCKKETPKETSFNPTSMEVTFPGSGTRYLFNYDAQLRIIKWTQSSTNDTGKVINTFDYQTDKLLITTRAQNGSSFVTSIPLDASGKAISYPFRYSKFEYNDEGYLQMAYTGDSSRFILSYSAGNLSSEAYFEADSFQGSIQYQYYEDKEDPYRLSTLFSEEDAPQALRLVSPIFGKSSKNLLKSFNEPGEGEFILKYQYDEKGFPTAVTASNGNDTQLVCTIVFKE